MPYRKNKILTQTGNAVVLFFNRLEYIAGVALSVWVRASKWKVRLDINQATKLILERRYRNGQMSKKEYLPGDVLETTEKLPN